jgi:hypothetical protein
MQNNTRTKCCDWSSAVQCSGTCWPRNHPNISNNENHQNRMHMRVTLINLLSHVGDVQQSYGWPSILFSHPRSPVPQTLHSMMASLVSSARSSLLWFQGRLSTSVFTRWPKSLETTSSEAGDILITLSSLGRLLGIMEETERGSLWLLLMCRWLAGTEYTIAISTANNWWSGKWFLAKPQEG